LKLRLKLSLKVAQSETNNINICIPPRLYYLMNQFSIWNCGLTRHKIIKGRRSLFAIVQLLAFVADFTWMVLLFYKFSLSLCHDNPFALIIIIHNLIAVSKWNQYFIIFQLLINFNRIKAPQKSSTIRFLIFFMSSLLRSISYWLTFYFFGYSICV
jgi:hypothetical protein